VFRFSSLYEPLVVSRASFLQVGMWVFFFGHGWLVVSQLWVMLAV
jgi:hypothetical protein